jgi:hypothetical protein
MTARFMMEFMGAYRRVGGTSDAVPEHADDEHGPAIDDGPSEGGLGSATGEATMSQAQDHRDPDTSLKEVSMRPAGRRAIPLGPVAFGTVRWR